MEMERSRRGACQREQLGLKRDSAVVDKKRIVFVSNMDGSRWGGSEELWAGAALNLASEGLSIGASVHGWSPPHQRVVKLAGAGLDVQLRQAKYPLWQRAWRTAFARNKRSADLEIAKFLAAKLPALVVISDPASTPPIGLLEECVAKGLPFVTISQSNSEHFWPDDSAAAGYRKFMPAARRCYFVSKGNHRLFEDQIGCELPNAEIVWNPFNVDFNAAPRWPPMKETGELRLASVARLHPPSKGQDILLEALADPLWRSRSWRLTLYGEGPMRYSIERMVQRLGLLERVRFAGFVPSVETIWSENHVLVMPSRYEGMPLAMVEAMLCARPVVATDVAGHSELVDDGVTGFLADAPTAPSVRRALERLWAERMDLQAIGKEAAKRIRERFPANPARTFAEKIKVLAGIG
jgi:glycosyltransferase involved in cell wall biosynthesis